MKEKFKSLILDDKWFYSLVILVVAIGSFWLGRATETENKVNQDSLVKIFDPVTPSSHQGQIIGAPAVNSTLSEGGGVKDISGNTVSDLESTTQVYVASKSGTKYHLASCPGAKQIKSENKINFATKEEAEAAGYSPAANCPGLK